MLKKIVISAVTVFLALVAWMAILALVTPLILHQAIAQVPPGEGGGGIPLFPLSFSDDFSSDSGLWAFVPKIINVDSGQEYPGSAYRDTDNQYLVLTEPKYHQGGVIWLNQDIFSPFIAEFKYKAGGGGCADGLVFMFYKKKDYLPYDGGGLGFVSPPGGPSTMTSVPGYGIEFDNYRHECGCGPGVLEDPSNNHIALIKDNVTNHLAYKNDPRTEDYEWHNVKVVVGNSKIEVYVDNESVINWEGNIDRTYGGIGFAGTTGGS